VLVNGITVTTPSAPTVPTEQTKKLLSNYLSKALPSVQILIVSLAALPNLPAPTLCT
jgi:hypothetical protein